MKNKNNNDFLNLILKLFESDSLVSDKTTEKELKEFLVNIIELCDISNLTLIISLLGKYTHKIETIVFFLEVIYLKKKLIKGAYNSNSKGINKQDDKQPLSREKSERESVNKAEREKMEKFTNQCVLLLSSINQDNSRANYSQALLLRLIIEEGIINFNINATTINEREAKSSILPLYQEDNSKNSLLNDLSVSESVINSLLLTYHDCNNETKLRIMRNESKLEGLTLGEYFNTKFTFQKKKVLIMVVNYLISLRLREDDLFMIYTGHFIELLIKLTELNKSNKNVTNYNICWFNHVFESNQICSKLFYYFFEKNGIYKSFEYLGAIIQTLIKWHSNPFVFRLCYSLFEISKDEASELLERFSFIFYSVVDLNNTIFIINIHQYTILLNSIPSPSSPSSITEKFIEAVLAFIQFLNKSELIYSTILINNQMTLLEMTVDILNKITKDDLKLIKEFVWNKQKTHLIFYEFDVKNSTLFSEVKQASSYSDKQLINNKLKHEDKSLVIKIYNKYGNDPRWINENEIKNKLEEEKEILEKTYSNLSASNKVIKKSSKDNIKNYQKDDLLENDKVVISGTKNDNLNDSFVECCECSYENHTINTKLTSIRPTATFSANENKSNESAIVGFYDITIPNAVICCKRDLLLKTFAINFFDIYFEDEQFDLVESNFKSYISSLQLNKLNFNESLRMKFPSKIKNFSSCSKFNPRIFLKKDPDFYHSKYFKLSHSYYTPIQSSKEIKTYNNLIVNVDNPFKTKFFNMNTNIFECKCELMKINYITTGNLYLSQTNILFISNENNKDFLEEKTSLDLVYCNLVNDIQQRNKEIIMLLGQIEEVIIRRFLYKYIAIEVFMKNGKSYFFNLHTSKNVLRINDNETMGILDHLNLLKKKYRNYKYNIVHDPKKAVSSLNLVQKWRINELSNFDFILLLNKFSGRSYNDLNQYPIVPWIYMFLNEKQGNQTEQIKTGNIQSKETFPSSKQEFTQVKDNNSLNSIMSISTRYQIRNLVYPVCIQNETILKIVEDKFKKNQIYDSDKSHISHFRLFYSNYGYCLFYLFRQNPFTHMQIIFQSGKFDNPSRQFTSISTLSDILQQNFDNRELVPEFFYSFEYYCNVNYCYYGFADYSKALVNNIEKPEFIGSQAQLSHMQFKGLNSDKIKREINDWIDNIFGYYQLKINNNTRMNIFDKFNYSSLIDLDKKIKKYNEKKLTIKEIISKINDKASKIISFGQAPEQLFTEPIKKWKNYIEKQKTYDDFSNVGNLINNLNVICKNTIHHDSKILYVNLTSNGSYIYTLIAEPKDFSYNTIKIYRNKTEFSNSDTIMISKMKLFKIKLDDSKKSYLNRYPPKYSIFDTCNGDYFFTCRHYDNSIKIYNKNGIVVSYLTDSFVLSLLRLKDNSFLSGSRDGKLVHWKISYKNSNVSLILKKSVFAHNGMISGIIYVKQHNIIITIGNDRNLFIRKFKTFELLTKISTKSDTDYFTDLAVSPFNQIFTMSIDTKRINPDKKCFYLTGYSMNGIIFYQSPEPNCFNTFCINNDGVIITGLFNTSNLKLFSLEWGLKHPKSVSDMQMQSRVLKFQKDFFQLNLEKEQLFTNFTYFDEFNTFYIITTNKVFRIAYNDQTNMCSYFHDRDNN